MDVSALIIERNNVQMEIETLKAELEGLFKNNYHSIKDTARITMLMNKIEHKESMLKLMTHQIDAENSRDTK